tara:strand:+ start:214 stop:519 length:306 start_codon:yes stop_codon:yes gene_type:complete
MPDHTIKTFAKTNQSLKDKRPTELPSFYSFEGSVGAKIPAQEVSSSGATKQTLKKSKNNSRTDLNRMNETVEKANNNLNVIENYNNNYNSDVNPYKDFGGG